MIGTWTENGAAGLVGTFGWNRSSSLMSTLSQRKRLSSARRLTKERDRDRAAACLWRDGVIISSSPSSAWFARTLRARENLRGPTGGVATAGPAAGTTPPAAVAHTDPWLPFTFDKRGRAPFTVNAASSRP